MVWSKWPRVVLKASPIDTFEEATWLETYGATYKWTTGNVGSQIITAFYIQDPQIAMLFKLIHYPHTSNITGVDIQTNELRVL